MIQITELSLPLGHADDAIGRAAAMRLAITEAQIERLTVFKRSYDARKKNTEIKFIYTLHLALEAGLEERVLMRFADDPKIKPAPDTEYVFKAQAPDNPTTRPVVVGFGPCGLFAALLLAQMGFKPIVIERGNNPQRDITYRTTKRFLEVFNIREIEDLPTPEQLELR